MHTCSVWLEHIVDAGVVFLIVTIFTASVHVYGIAGLQAARETLRVTLRETSSTTDIRLAPHKCGLAGASFSSLVDMVFAMKGPLRGVKETISESPLWLHARRIRSISYLHIPSNRVKLVKDKYKGLT
jgi:hypothetical protein